MDDGQTKVLVVSRDEVYGNALRRVLNGAYSTESTNTLPSSDPRVDIIVWHSDDPSAPTESMLERFSCPTLILGPAREEMIMAALEARAAGFVAEDASVDEIVEAIDVVVGGGAVVPPNLLGTVLRLLVDKRRRLEPELLAHLTPRELEVFELAANGARHEEIAESMFISPNTARTHLQRVYRKLGIHSRSELVAVAARTGHLQRKESQ